MPERQDQPRTDAAVRSDGDDLARLMGEEQRGRRSTPGRGADSLGERALREAERAVQESEQALAEAATVESAAADAAPRPVVTVEVPPSLRRQLRILQVALLASVVVGIVAMTWPSGPALDAGRRPEAGVPAGAPRAGVAIADGGVQTDPYYQAALSAGLDGEFRLAADHLGRAMQRHPDMEPAVEQLVHAQLAYYLRKSGQLSAAMKHDRLSRTGSQRAFLGDELWSTARAAEQRGDGVEARRAYARFLLQGDALTPELRQLVGEAWMGLGDSYELQIRSAEPVDVSGLEAQTDAAADAAEPVRFERGGDR